MSTKKRPTPETDSAKINVGSDCGGFSRWMTEVEFSEHLERQRDELKERVEAEMSRGEEYCRDFIAMRKERDQWREWHENTRKGGQVLAAERDELLKEIERLKVTTNTLAAHLTSCNRSRSDHAINFRKADVKRIEAEREKCEKLEDIIRRASTKFCEDGPDGEIAAGMFRILGEKAPEQTKMNLSEAIDVVVGNVQAVCTWKEDDCGYYATTCGHMHSFFNGGPKQNFHSFCPYCGGVLKL